jgi:hypothetical protein
MKSLVCTFIQDKEGFQFVGFLVEASAFFFHFSLGVSLIKYLCFVTGAAARNKLECFSPHLSRFSHFLQRTKPPLTASYKLLPQNLDFIQRKTAAYKRSSLFPQCR